MVRNILIINTDPRIRKECISKFVGGSSCVSFCLDPILGHCAKHAEFNKICILCQRRSTNQMNIKEEKQCSVVFKHIISQSNHLNKVYRHAHNLDVLESIIRKALGIAVDRSTRTIEKLRNIIRIKKSSVITAKLTKEEKECFDNLWITPHAFIILADVHAINHFMDNLEILDILNSVDNPFIHVFYELDNESQIPEMLIEYELNGLMTVLK